MKGYLIDTNVLSEFSRRHGPDSRVATWLRKTPREIQFVSVITLGEIERGIELLDPGRRRHALEARLTGELEVWFAGRILAVTRRIASAWGSLQATHAKTGRTLATVDALIAATTLEHDLTLVTRNISDFEGLGVELSNPWARGV